MTSPDDSRVYPQNPAIPYGSQLYIRNRICYIPLTCLSLHILLLTGADAQNTLGSGWTPTALGSRAPQIYLEYSII